MSVAQQLNNLIELSKKNSTFGEIHIAFMGDSLTRYQFLDLAYAIDSGGTRTPDYLINHDIIVNRHEFYFNTTKTFKGRMTCDCFRSEEKYSSLDTVMENRLYRKGSLVLSYTQLLGDYKVNGHITPDHIFDTSQLSAYPIPPTWSYTFIESVRNWLIKLEPHPTHYVLNIGLHPYSKSIHDIPLALFLLWRDLMEMNKEGEVVNEKKIISSKVIWKETSIRKNVIKKDLIWNGYETDKVANEICLNSSICSYLHFDIPCDELTYVDGLHYNNPGIYRQWNTELLGLLFEEKSESVDLKKILPIIIKNEHKISESDLQRPG